MTPSEEVVDIVGGVIAKYQETHKIKIFSLTVLSNHYHILCNAPESNLWEFAKDVNKEVARRINRHIKREGVFWGRRYDDNIVIEDIDALEGLLYVTTNPTKHGLVEQPKSWPGLNTYFALTTGRLSSYYFTNWTTYSKAKRRAQITGEKVSIRDHQSKHLLKISPIPLYDTNCLKEQAKIITPLIKERAEKLAEERRKAGKGFLGRKKILAQSPFEHPHEVNKTPRPSCYTKSPSAKRQFDAEEKVRREMYEIASYQFRSGDYDVEFPPFCYKPPLHCVSCERLEG